MEFDLSFADVDGTGSHWCAGVGFAGSSGGAFMLLLGIEATGCEWRTSFFKTISNVMRKA